MKILLIEDTIEFAAKARTVYERDGHNVIWVTNFEDALPLLNDVEMIVSDCFFPESAGQVRKSNARDLARKIIEVINGPSEDFGKHTVVPIQILNRACLDEDAEMPLGLVIVIHATNKGLPCVLVSQGDRHHEKLGGLRFAFESAGFWIMSLFSNSGGMIDKSNEKTWMDAIMWAQGYSGWKQYKFSESLLKDIKLAVAQLKEVISFL